METKINIAEILKDKPQGTKLYSSACGKCKLEEVDDKSFKISFYNSKFGFMNGGEGYLDKNGKLYDDGECVVFPSREMRDWRKFAWKKGDVLVGCSKTIVFDGFTDDTYTLFKGKHCLQEDRYSDKTTYIGEDKGLLTKNFHIPEQCTAQAYIKVIEKRLGGKLNRETLEIEKNQPEFKDGDIVCISGMGYLAYGIVKSIDYSSKKIEYYVLNDMSFFKINDWLSFEDKQIQPITETQQIILFDALAKEGKSWDSEKKAIVDLKPKVELKAFDKVLVRNDKEDQWSANIFSYQIRDMYHCLGECYWKYCIPYEGNEYLLGTTKDMEG